MKKYLPKPLKIVALSSDLLLLDKVMTLAQARRHYGLDEREIRRGFLTRDAKFTPLNTSSLRLKTTFITVPEYTELLEWQPTWELAHLAGTAELRHVLGVERAKWPETTQPWVLEGSYGEKRPDAEWKTPDGKLVAVEYDAGYPPAVVREKLKAFDRYDDVYWGTPSAIRCSHLESRHSGKAHFLTLDFTSSGEGHR